MIRALRIVRSVVLLGLLVPGPRDAGAQIGSRDLSTDIQAGFEDLRLSALVAAHGVNPPTGRYDLLLAIHRMDGGMARAVLGAIDVSALPVTFAGGPILGAGRLIEGRGFYGDAWRATLSVAGGLVISGVLKRVVRRERPFVTVPGVTARTSHAGARAIDRWAFPSGHSTMAAALAVSLSLDHPNWYVIAPAALWATGVGVSRVWLGVHFPGDVLAGWALGAAVAWTVHHYRRGLTPSGWDPEPGSMPVSFSMVF